MDPFSPSHGTDPIVSTLFSRRKFEDVYWRVNESFSQERVHVRTTGKEPIAGGNEEDLQAGKEDVREHASRQDLVEELVSKAGNAWTSKREKSIRRTIPTKRTREMEIASSRTQRRTGQSKSIQVLAVERSPGLRRASVGRGCAGTNDPKCQGGEKGWIRLGKGLQNGHLRLLLLWTLPALLVRLPGPSVPREKESEPLRFESRAQSDCPCTGGVAGRVLLESCLAREASRDRG